MSSFKNQERCASLLAKAVMHFCNYWHVMPWLTERSSGSSRLTSEAWYFLLTDALSAIQIQKSSFYTWITGKTSLSKQRFPADVGYTSWCSSIFIGSFPWTFLRIRQPPAFPCRLQHSIIGRFGLNRRVRDGYGCVPEAHRHRKYRYQAFFLGNSTVKHNPLLLLPF